jgi:hypothetical protein
MNPLLAQSGHAGFCPLSEKSGHGTPDGPIISAAFDQSGLERAASAAVHCPDLLYSP